MYWLVVGAQPSDTAQALLKKQGVYDRIANAMDREPIRLPNIQTGKAPAGIQWRAAGEARSSSTLKPMIEYLVKELVDEPEHVDRD